MYKNHHTKKKQQTSPPDMSTTRNNGFMLMALIDGWFGTENNDKKLTPAESEYRAILDACTAY